MNLSSVPILPEIIFSIFDVLRNMQLLWELLMSLIEHSIMGVVTQFTSTVTYPHQTVRDIFGILDIEQQASQNFSWFIEPEVT